MLKCIWLILGLVFLNTAQAQLNRPVQYNTNTESVSVPANFWQRLNSSLKPTSSNSISLGDSNKFFTSLFLATNGVVLVDGTGTNTFNVGVPYTLASNINFILPASHGSAGQVLSTDANGILSWINQSVGSGTNILIQTNGVDYGSAGTFNFGNGFTSVLSGSVFHVGITNSGGGGSGSQTPYTSTHDAAGYNISNITAIALGAAVQGTEPIRIGTNVSRSVDAQILIARRMTNEASGLNTNGHAFSDSTVIARSTAGHAYNSFDARVVITNAAMDHYAAFQSIPQVDSGTVSNIYGLYVGLGQASGTIRTNTGVMVDSAPGATIVHNQGIRLRTPTGSAPSVDIGLMIDPRHATAASYHHIWINDELARISFGANRDLILNKDRAYTLQLWVDATAGDGVDTELHGTDADGTDMNGGDLTLSGGRNTGAGVPGAIVFSTSPYGASGSASNNLVERLGIYTNAIIVPSTADLRILGHNLTSNYVWTATNATTGEGEWRAQAAGSGGGGAGSLPFDLTQFTTNGTVTVKDGASLTNTVLYAPTANGTVTILSGELKFNTDGHISYESGTDTLRLTNTFHNRGIDIDSSIRISDFTIAPKILVAFTNLASSTSNSFLIVSNCLVNVPSNTVHTASIALVGAAVTTGVSNIIHPSWTINNLPSVGGMAGTLQFISRTNFETGTIVATMGNTGNFIVTGALLNNGGSSGLSAAGGLTATSVATTGNFAAGQGSSASSEKIRSTNNTAGVMGIVVDQSHTVQTNMMQLRVAGIPRITAETNSLTLASNVVFTLQSGANQRAGNATLVGGTVTVNNGSVTANTIVMLTRKTSGGTIGTGVTYTVSAGISFTITSDNVLDTSTFSYLLIEVP